VDDRLVTPSPRYVYRTCSGSTTQGSAMLQRVNANRCGFQSSTIQGVTKLQDANTNSTHQSNPKFETLGTCCVKTITLPWTPAPDGLWSFFTEGSSATSVISETPLLVWRRKSPNNTTCFWLLRPNTCGQFSLAIWPRNANLCLSSLVHRPAAIRSVPSLSWRRCKDFFDRIGFHGWKFS
jgi:hypothetical protein